MTTIPGTNYQVSGNQILAPDGQAISKDQFIAKVQSKEISLTENSLRFLDSQLGPDMTQSLFRAAGMQVPVDQLIPKLMTSSDSLTGDLYSLMEAIAKLTQEQRKAAREVRHAEFGLQISELNKAADEALEAAKWRLAAGVVSGALTIGAGALSAQGGIEGTDAAMAQYGGYSKVVEGFSKIAESGIGYGGAVKDRDAETARTNAKKFEEMTSETKDLQNAIREMESKVREILQAIQAAESDAAKTVARS